MPRAKECESCQMFSGHLGSEYAVCSIHPSGPAEVPCPDHAPIEDCVPVGAAYYGDELIRDWPGYMSSEVRLELIETHPLFTGKCPQCGNAFKEPPLAHWDYPECNWMDDMVFRAIALSTNSRSCNGCCDCNLSVQI